MYFIGFCLEWPIKSYFELYPNFYAFGKNSNINHRHKFGEKIERYFYVKSYVKLNKTLYQTSVFAERISYYMNDVT